MAQYSQLTIKKSVDMKSRLEDAILGSVNARSELIARRRQPSAVPSTPRSSRASSGKSVNIILCSPSTPHAGRGNSDVNDHYLV